MFSILFISGCEEKISTGCADTFDSLLAGIGWGVVGFIFSIGFLHSVYSGISDYTIAIFFSTKNGTVSDSATEKQKNIINVLLLIGALFAFSIGLYFSLRVAIDNPTPDNLQNTWILEHPQAVSASYELKMRLENHLCLICGNASKWALEDYDNDDNGKFVLATEVRNKEENVEFACENHTDYLHYLNKGDDKGSVEYVDHYYQGPGQSEIKLAAIGRLKPSEEDKDKLEGHLKLYISISIILFGYILTLGYIIKNKIITLKNTFSKIDSQNMLETSSNIIGARFQLLSIIAICILVLALNTHNPYGYYKFLRFVCCPILGYLAFVANKGKKYNWVMILGILALIYNPIYTAHLGRGNWSVVNIATIAAILLFAKRNKYFRKGI